MPMLPSPNPKQFAQGAPVLHVPDVTPNATFIVTCWDSGSRLARCARISCAAQDLVVWQEIA